MTLSVSHGTLLGVSNWFLLSQCWVHILRRLLKVFVFLVCLVGSVACIHKENEMVSVEACH